MDKVEPLVAELIQCADTTLALENDTDSPRRCSVPAAARRGRAAAARPVSAAAAVAAPPSERERELKPLLCDMCKRACAARPTDVDAFFVAYLEEGRPS